MGGFFNTSNPNTDVMYVANLDFSGNEQPTATFITAGKFPIATGNLPPTLPQILPGTITSSSLAVTYSTPNIKIETKGGGSPIEQITIDNSTVPGTNPVLPTGTGNITITGAQVANASLANVIQTHSFAANSFAVAIQRSTTSAVSNSAKNGVSHFDSARFTVDGNGFVSINGAGIGETITGDSGGALSPTSGNWNIFGKSGSITSGSGSTLTVKSPAYADASASASSSVNTGEFVTGAFTRTLPAVPSDGDLVEYVCISASALVITAAGAQKIRIGTLLSAAGGTATSTSIGDSVSLRYRATDGFWYATSVIGTWLIP